MSGPRPRRELAACKTLGIPSKPDQNAACSRLSIIPFATGPERAMGHVPGAKKEVFLIRGRGRPTVYGGRDGLILSIPAREVSLGLFGVGAIHG